MGRVGRGNAAEESLTKQEKKKRRLNNQDLSDIQSTEHSFKGVLSSSNIPKKLETLDNEDSLESNKQSTDLSLMYRNAEALELRYQTLAEGGLKLLEAVENDEDLSKFDNNSLKVIVEQDLVKLQEKNPVLTHAGTQTYNNWTNFRDDYLTGNTANNRLETIESELGEQSMPWFLEETSDMKITLDQYLRKKDKFMSRYEPKSEFQSIINSIYSYDSTELGERVRALEVLSEPEKYDKKQVPKEIKNEFRDATPIGLINNKDILTQDGEVLYRKIRTDSHYI